MERAKKLYIACLFALVPTFGLCNVSQGTFLSLFIDDYQLQGMMQGMPSAMQQLGGIICFPILLAVMGHIKKQVLLFIALLMALITTLLLGAFPPFSLLLLAYLIFGVAFGIHDSASASLLTEICPAGVGIMSGVHALYSFSGVVGPFLLLGLVNAGLHWSRTFLVLALIAFLTALYILFVFRSKHKLKTPLAPPVKLTVSGWRSFTQDRRNLFMLLIFFFFGAQQMGIIVWIARYITVELKGPADMGALALSLFWAGNSAIRLLNIKLGRLKPMRVIALGNCISALIFAAGVVLRNPWFMVCCSFTSGLGIGSTVSMGLYETCRINAPNTILASSFIFLSRASSNTLMMVLFGELVALWGMPVSMLIVAGTGICTATFAFCEIRAQRRAETAA